MLTVGGVSWQGYVSFAESTHDPRMCMYRYDTRPRWNVTMERNVLGFWLAGRGTLRLGHGNTDQHQRVLESGNLGALTFCPCLDISSIAPMERYALHFLACRAVVSLSTPTEWLTLKAAISMTTPLLMCACIFEPFPELSSIAQWYAHCWRLVVAG